MKIFWPLVFALIAAFGNAMFAAGQKKAVLVDNPFGFVVLSAVVGVALSVAVAPLLGTANYSTLLKENGLWLCLSGAGLFLTYLGFNLLYTRYGASHYILYAVLSIITTAIFVGVVLFRENFNYLHWAAMVSAILTIVLFGLGSRLSP